MIRKLSPEVINAIAAGEVVERPASIIKELVENAIDAKSTEIRIEINNGGLDLIEVSDNGVGISKDDLQTVFERFTTSKLTDIADLEAIATFGFRGEALSAIGAVSNTTITSCTKEGEPAITITSNYSAVSDTIPGSRGVGTIVSVARLFSQLPARLKFVKTSGTEKKYILSLLNNYLLANLYISFNVIIDGKTIYSFVKGETLTYRASKLFSVEEKDLLPINHTEYDINVSGVMLKPDKLSSVSRFSNILVNKRPIIDKAIANAANSAVIGYVPINYKNSFYIELIIPGNTVDVNAHPRKTEVRFVNPYRIYSAVRNSITHALAGFSKENVSISGSSSYNINNQYYTSRENNAYNRLRDAPGSEQSLYNSSYGNDDTLQEFAVNISDIPDSEDYSDIATQLSSMKVVPLLKRYILLEKEDEIWIFDQHAAAERTRFEKLQAIIDGKSVDKQSLLLPIKLHLPQDSLSNIDSVINFIHSLGFETKLEGGQITITSVPILLKNADYEQLLVDSLTELTDDIDTGVITLGGYALDNKMNKIIATIACHSSVRMHEALTEKDARSIINDLLQCKIPYACPHGRRLLWKLTPEEINRNFMR